MPRSWKRAPAPRSTAWRRRTRQSSRRCSAGCVPACTTAAVTPPRASEVCTTSTACSLISSPGRIPNPVPFSESYDHARSPSPTIMKLATLALSAALAFPVMSLAQVADPAYGKNVADWRAKVEKSLRADNGWLTLAGRYVLKPGENTFGNGPGNDIVFPKGVGSPGMGSVFVENGRGTRKMVEGLKMRKDGIDYTTRDMGTDAEKRDWVSVGRVSFHFIERDGKFIMRLADHDTQV